MSSNARIVVFGATGYTGRLTVEALLDAGTADVVLAGRDTARLAALAASLGAADLELARAGADADELAAQLRPGDVLVSTVGPFSQLGEAAVLAAISSGAAYLDCSGEGSFHRTVFETHGPRAAAAGVQLLTGLGADWVPGNVVAATALERLAPGVAHTAVVEYFITGDGFEFSEGSVRTGAAMMADPQPPLAWRDGQLREVPQAPMTLHHGSAHRLGGLVGSTESFALPRLEPSLREISVYLGMPPALPTSADGGPSAAGRAQNSQVVTATILDEAGRPASGARLTTINGYDYTAAALAWGARRVRDGGAAAVGALGPVEAFGLPALRAFHDSLGSTVVSWDGPSPEDHAPQDHAPALERAPYQEDIA